MHLGEVQVLKAVENLFLASFMHNVIFIPQTGEMQIPKMCSVSDLDVHLYFCHLLSNLDYRFSRRASWLCRTCTWCRNMYWWNNNGSCGWFHDWFHQKRSTWIIVNSHVAHVDQRKFDIWDSLSLLIDGIFALAVEFPKTGFLATIPDDYKVEPSYFLWLF